MSDYSDFTSIEEKLILRQAPHVFYHRSNPMIEMDNKMLKERFSLSKYVIIGLELRLFSYIREYIFIHRTSNITFSCLARHAGSDGSMSASSSAGLENFQPRS